MPGKQLTMQEPNPKQKKAFLERSRYVGYRAFREVVLMVVELIRQFYTLPRCFRVIGRDGQERYVQYSNAGITQQDDGSGMRMPLFDIEISAQKQSPYSKMSQNELAMQFYNSGFFNPQMADQALACLDMMDFDRKNAIMQKIMQNGTMYQQMQMMQQQLMGMAAQLDAMQGSNLQQQVMQQAGMAEPGMGAMTGATAQGQQALGDEAKIGEAGNTKKARQRVADSTAPA